MRDLLLHLLAGPAGAGGAPRESTRDVPAFWEYRRAQVSRFDAPIDQAIAGGFEADRLGFAFVAGYHAALAAMLPGVVGGDLGSLCITEAEGGHPRAIRTSLERDEAGRLRIRGEKRWSTLAPLASELFVAASIGVDPSGVNRLRLVRVRAGAPGVRISPMAPTPFIPEIPHAEIALDGVLLDDADVLEGDGYDTYVKPFRTFEDLHVHGALLGYLVGVGRRCGWPAESLERVAAAIVAVRALSGASPRAPETHVALAGVIAEARQIVASTAPLWQRAGEEERARWERDLPLLDIAARAREARRARAWALLSR